MTPGGRTMPRATRPNAFRRLRELPLVGRAMDMIAERVIRAREDHWEERNAQGWKVDRTLGFAHLGGATLDNEENYLIKKLFTAMGAVQIENQARISHSSTVPGL